MEALKQLINNGSLECDEKYIQKEKVGYVYDWIIEKMNNSMTKDKNSKYPLWAWVKFKDGICPPKHKRNTLRDEITVKITFKKDRRDCFITDYRKYSFLLNNMYIPENNKQKDWFDNQLIKYNITIDELKAYVRTDKYKTHRQDEKYLSLCKKIKESRDSCITNNADIMQACVWKISINEVQSIEILNDRNYDYGTYNYIRSNGKRFNWIDNYYKDLK
jgi:hypothetical protein